MPRAWRPALLPLALAACASVGPPELDPDLSDPAGAVDLGSDLSGCTLGSVDHCGSCSTACPGMDNAGTKRTCSDLTAAGTCDILCKGEFYDVDADPANGCELEDVAQATVATAVDLTLPNVAPAAGTCDNTNNGCTISRAIASDARKHDTVPTDRPNGREDWYKVVAVGAGGANPMKACLGIANATWPVDNQYEVCISANGSQDPTTSCKTAVARQAAQCVQPTGNTDAGTYYVRIRKTVGTPTGLGYALYLEH